MKSSERSFAVPNSHIERKNEILETLQKQVLVIKGLLEKQKTLAHSDIETLIPLIDKEYNEALEKFNETAIEKYKVYKKLLEEFVTTSSTLSIFDFENASEKEISEYENMHQQSEYLSEKIDNLCTSEVSFIEHIEDFFIRIKLVALRNAEVRREKQSASDISPFLDDNGKLCGRFIPEDVVRLDEDAFSTVFIIKKKSWLKNVSGNVDGYYIPNTDFIFIQDGFNERKTRHILEHERMHHMLDGISRYEVTDPSKQIIPKFSRIVRLKRLNAPTAIIQAEINNLLGSDFAKELINSTQNEFLAAYEESKGSKFGHTELNLFGKIYAIDSNTNAKRSTSFKTITNSLSTAGSHIHDAHSYLTVIVEMLQKEGLGEYSEMAKNQVVRFEDLFLQMIDQVNQANDYSKILGRDVDLEIKALLILLEPTSYHHIITYLNHEHKSAMTLIKENKKLFLDKIINSDTLKQFCDSAIKSRNNLDQEQKNQFFEAVKKYLDGEYNDDFLEEACNHPLKAITLLDEIATVLDQNSDSNSQNDTFAKRYLMTWLIPWKFDFKVFEEIPDNFFSGEENTNIVNEFISGLDFKDEFDDKKKQEVLKFFKRVGLS